MGPVTRVIQTGIGLAAELKAARKEQQESEASPNGGLDVEKLQLEDKDSDDEASKDDEHFGGGELVYRSESNATDLNEETPPPYSAKDVGDTSDVKFSPMPSDGSSPKWSCPVVIPQRRPGSKTRGFLRAYAPALADRDIDQDTFLTFLKSFHSASQASPILNVITIGAGALGNIPEPFSMVAAIGISVLSGTAAEMQSRYRTNNYLDQANELLFKPKGLYALIMSFRPGNVPNGDVAMEPVDSSQAALKWLTPNRSTFRTYASNLRDYSGKTQGELEMPETAALIYPETGYAEIAKPKKGEASRGSISQYRKVAANYFDKRAQAKYAYKHPDSALALETPPQFASKYGDPTHPSVTTNYAGRIASAIKHESLADRQARRHEKSLQSQGSWGPIRRLLQPSVLYLMIVDLPTDEEMAEARKAARSNSSQSTDEVAG